MSVEITGLYIYPVKSLKGIALEKATLTPQGFLNDRRWMVVRSSGRFVTQRDLSRLALIHTGLSDSGVTLTLDGHGAVTVPFDSTGGEPVQTRVWGDACETVDEGGEVSRWLTAATECSEKLRLVHMQPGFVRPQGKPRELGEQTSTFFADAAPFLVAGEASLNELNRELAARGHPPVPMDRFRPNVVVRGLQPFAEHGLAGLENSAYGLKFCHPCERCVVTTINQDTAAKDPARQPFITLTQINPVPGKKPAPAFGQNAILGRGDGEMATLGDRLSAA
ncbi:MAG: MOSC domain-containing protein [Xanthomonadales bacterium]|nr:MOSC N-terminal beta barrel domain-containing protein [Gammaproteobacteria bacterium]NND58542.1 MOSC domain-containing protein [Xanthomonadales bacterium]NNK52236.1 MOSC domain-containing protein [Xanthomonadales bacterium]